MADLTIVMAYFLFFCQSKIDPSLYTLIHDGHMFALAVYVDDCLLIGKNVHFWKCLSIIIFFLALKLKIPGAA